MADSGDHPIKLEQDEIVQAASQVEPEDIKASSASLNENAARSSEEDNMEYDSDDDEDDGSNHSNDESDEDKTKTSVKRSHHNVLERKRRDLIKDSFSELKGIVPTLKADRASRAQILKHAAEFIQSTLASNGDKRAELAKIELLNKQRDEELARLAKETQE